MKKLLLFSAVIVAIILLGIPQFIPMSTTPPTDVKKMLDRQAPATTPPPTPSPTPIPQIKVLENNYHVYQTFNNCGPASLSMALSYYGINVSQQELGSVLRPYQIPSGDNDDKSVTLDELAQHAKVYGLVSYHRPGGNQDLIKKLIAAGFPVITRTTTKPSEDIGHFRIIKGYDDVAQDFIQDDSLQGHNLRYSFGDFNDLWQVFNYEFLVLVPPDKETPVRTLLGDLALPNTAWQQAVTLARNQLQADPTDIFARFNLAVAHYHLGNYQQSVSEYEVVASSLPARTLWYQLEPLHVYYELGQYDKIFQITDAIFQNGNRAYAEAYLLRGKFYQNQGQFDLARSEYQKAVFYNQNLRPAQEALSNLQ
jgi:tetratricopeptide (TPR) repeat protein